MFKKLFIGLAVLLIICVLVAWFALPRILVPQAENKLRAMGFESVTLSDIGISLHGLTVGRVMLVDNGQSFTAEDMALQWHGFDPRHLDKLHINHLTIPLDMNRPGAPLKLDLNLGNSGTNSAAFDIPEVEIARLTALTSYKDQIYPLTAKNIRILPQDSGYQIYGQIPLSENDFKQHGSAAGLIHTAAYYKSAGHFELAFELENVALQIPGETPVQAENINGDIRYLQEIELPFPLLSVKLDADTVNVDGAVFRKIQLDTEKLSDSTYHILAKTDPDGATTLELDALADLSKRSIDGTFDTTSTDLSTAPQDYPQLANPVLAGMLDADFRFNITAPDTPDMTQLDLWRGNITGDIALDDVNYNDIKDINSNINLKYELADRALETEFDFKAASPVLNIAGDLTFKNNRENQTTVITGVIDKIVFDVFDLKSKNAYITYNRRSQKTAFDLKGATITPKRAFAKYPSLSGRARGTFETPQLGFNFSGVESGGRFNVQANGQYNTGNKNLDLTYKLLPERTFSAADITKLFPELKQSLNGFSGKIAIDGAGKLRNGSFTSRQSVKIDADSATINTIEVIGIAGVIDIANTPAIVIEKEEVFIGGLDVGGLPLKEGNIIFSFNSAKDLLTIHDMNWTLADGKLTTAPFTFNTKTRSGDLLLKADRIDLKPLFSYLPMEGLTASGHVSGEIPVSLKQGKIEIQQGHLQAVDTGDLQYDPEDPPSFLQQDNPYINMVRDALKDYNYNILSLTVDGRSGENQKVVLKASGSNPQFFDGRPVNLNLNIEGELEDLLKFNVGAFSIPERIKKKMMAFEE